jgi:hypothetical protein
MHPTARAADASPQVIYGRDTRIEVNRLTGPRAELARATAGLMAGNQQLAGQTITLQPKTLQQAFGLCADQRFAQQPVQAFCSAVLVAPDVVLTAGHCIKASDGPRGAPLDETLVVFGFQMLPSGLLMKFAKGATITTLHDRYLFANLDAFSGSFGSPVLDARSNRLVGMLDESQAESVARGPCKVVNLVPQVPGKEGVTRVGVFRDEIGRLP